MISGNSRTSTQRTYFSRVRRTLPDNGGGGVVLYRASSVIFGGRFFNIHKRRFSGSVWPEKRRFFVPFIRDRTVQIIVIPAGF